MSEKSDRVRKKIGVNFENWRTVIRQCLLDAGESVPSGVDRDRLATFVLTVMEGAVMLARSQRSLTPFDDAIGSLRDYFGRMGAGVSASGT